jgi:precorrin-8X/cobalt-precorrin-8 methylmutase
MSLDYEREPAAIYRQSFATVEAEADLSGLPEDARPVAVRLIHACGMVEIAPDIVCSPELVAAATAALSAGAPVLCDCEMVRSGVIRRMLPSENNVIATIGDGGIPDLADRIGNTRSAAAVELWRDHLAGSVVAVGNAPTALFHLLELLDQDWPKPAAILGFPVGFVGAAESKAELAANARSIPFITLKGRRGGSAMASAAVNALSSLAAHA